MLCNPHGKGVAIIAMGFLIACGSDPSGARINGASGSGAGGTGASGSGGAAASTGGTIGNPDGSTPNLCGTQPETEDRDGDGFTGVDDCNDCVASVYPGATEVLGNNIDEDCDGLDTLIAEDGGSAIEHMPCDDGLAIDSSEPNDGARAIGLCAEATSADYSDAVGTPGLDSMLQVGLLERFGVHEPREGARMLLLSTGDAREPGDPAHTRGCDSFGDTVAPSPSPDGFPQASPPPCATSPVAPEVELYNVAALSVDVRAPEGATAFSVDFNFFTAEYPNHICAEVNDAFVILMDPPPEGAENGNIAFDSRGTPISLNAGLLSVCQPPIEIESPLELACEAGTALLEGTGYDVEACDAAYTDQEPGEPGASTGWLTTTVPVESGQTFSLRFVIWDAYDTGVDSSVLIDNFEFSGEATDGGTVKVPITKPSAPE